MNDQKQELLVPPTIREEWVDVLKGVLIGFVVIGHCIITLNPADNFQRIVLVLIYTIHMPMFFILSGYTLKVKKNLIEFIVKKLKTIMVPYLMFVIVDTFIEYIMGVYSIQEIFERFLNQYLDIVLITTKSPYSSLWFLPAICGGIIITFIIEKLLYKRSKRILASVILVIIGQIIYMRGIESYFGVREALIAQFFILLGFELKKIILKLKNNFSAIEILILLLIWLYVAFEWVSNGHSTINYWNSDVAPIVWTFAIAGIAATVLLATIGFWEKHKGKLFDIFAYLGKNTLYIYGFHYIFLRVYPNIVTSKINGRISFLVLTILVLVSSLVLTIVYKKSKKTIVRGIIHIFYATERE